MNIDPGTLFVILAILIVVYLIGKSFVIQWSCSIQYGEKNNGDPKGREEAGDTLPGAYTPGANHEPYPSAPTPSNPGRDAAHPR